MEKLSSLKIVLLAFLACSTTLTSALIPTSANSPANGIAKEEFVLDGGNADVEEVSSSGKLGRCLVDFEEMKPKKFLQYENTTLPIILETSVWKYHQLLTASVKIFLTEVVGYDSVIIKEISTGFDGKETVARIAGLKELASTVVHANTPDLYASIPPETMVNLGVRLPPALDVSFASVNGVVTLGDAGFAGRFSWLMLKNPMLVGKSGLDFWKSFQNHESRVISQFSLEGEDWEYAVKFTQDPSATSDNNKFYCKEEYCKNGIYKPDSCDLRHSHCAVLLAGFPDSTHLLHRQISGPEPKLRVQIMFLGPHLEDVINHFARKYRNSSTQGLLFFSWDPNVIPYGMQVERILFPGCKDNDLCYSEWHRLTKVAWTYLERGAKTAFQALTAISFAKQEEFLSLVDFAKESWTADPDLDVEAVACGWMKQASSQEIWKHWIPRTPDNTITIGGIFPMTGSFTAHGVVQAARMASEAVNDIQDILPNYNFKLLAQDGGCRSDLVMTKFIDYIKVQNFPTFAGVLGPACSDTVDPLAGVARHFRTMVISYSAEGSTYSDRSIYPYFFRTIGENKQYLPVYSRIMRKFKWNQVASLTEEGQKLGEYVSKLQDLLQGEGIRFLVNRKIPRDRTGESMKTYLANLREHNARIIVADFYVETARAVMCEVYKQNMTLRDGYVWFLPTWFQSDWYDTDKMSKKDVDCTTKEMRAALDGHLSLEYAYYAADSNVMQENITVGEWRARYGQQCAKKKTVPSDYGGYAYDAVWVYAHALDKLLKQNPKAIGDLHTDETTKEFVKIIEQTDFQGVSGRINFVGGPSRISVINVVQWLNGTKKIVGSFDPLVNKEVDINNGTFHINDTEIRWFTTDNAPPHDGTPEPQQCVLNSLAVALGVSCEIAIVIANVTGFGILGMVLVMCFVVIKRRYDRREKMREEAFRNLGFDERFHDLCTPDKFEIPRDRVVLNRKLGEGAFGTVYGGECFFDEKGWVGVAVKTLKVGSTCEMKYDFLSEAEVMKHFEHKNIIKLLGVCTKVEPVYTIMEFMLYGDLKTYLLERRHLVNERNCEESDEVSSKRLTTMTLDIARALSYLAEMKYVHRDVACRNCLVSASRVIKLGDFGMTRRMYDNNDYYRFNRKGMLPVRWMAPESLALGIFTPMSDVWSFGVVLYEVITFGSFPFQGLSNNQVLEVVKQGATIQIPAGVKPHLDHLLKSCWSMEPQKRPQSAQIVEFLANNPRIIHPCLDIPLASVQMEGTDQLEIQLSDKFRKLNSRLSKPSLRKPLLEKESSLNSPEIIPLTPNGHSRHGSGSTSSNDEKGTYATLHHDPELI